MKIYICGVCGNITASTIEANGSPAMCGECWEIFGDFWIEIISWP